MVEAGYDSAARTVPDPRFYYALTSLDPARDKSLSAGDMGAALYSYLFEAEIREEKHGGGGW